MAKRRIHSKGAYSYEERLAGEAGIYPGMLLEVNSAGAVIKHNSEAARAEKIFALEDALQGSTVATVFTAANPVPVIIPNSGSEVNALIKAGENIAIGDELMSAGDGTLIAVGSISSGVTLYEVVAVALEAEDLSGSGDVNTLIRVRVK